jgi:hypothetical protein
MTDTPTIANASALAIAEKLIRAYLLDIGAGIDDFTPHEVEFAEKIADAIGAAAQAPASSGAQALGIAERFRVFFRRPYWTSEDGVERAVQSLAEAFEAVIGRDRAPPGADAMEIAAEVVDGWESGSGETMRERVAAAIEAAIAERDTERTERDGICFREGVEFGRAQMGKHGPSALEATRDWFQSLEGWRPTDDWAGVPGRLKLLFDRTLHAIENAEARGRSERDK